MIKLFHEMLLVVSLPLIAIDWLVLKKENNLRVRDGCTATSRIT